ncbi:peptide deformylase [Chitinophaga oryzae]|uniref:Peptide deformylase n=1 Tax=Chitinophaga oryzae TaxID=2725414 RepID=A0AAE7D6L4_9BACT|nr:peptide deformylase [Chitinophaga oryzae]QJB30166.1 peptide deformylase [Chitinophaga oryzae]QJB36664.1 peptide deformylase [Chitinophaga oryzae]
MILPVMAYGHTILRTPCTEVPADFPGLAELVENMWQTLAGARGVGLAAPQVNQPLRLFIVESRSTFNQLGPEERARLFPDGAGIRETFINPRITAVSAEDWEDEEGCLSIPGLWAPVRRPWSITIEYQDADLRPRRRTCAGLTARMIQHEYDHLEGRLYLDLLSPLQRKLLAGKLEKVRKGRYRAGYPIK